MHRPPTSSLEPFTPAPNESPSGMRPPGATAVAARRPGWWQRNWKWAVPLGVATLIGGIIAFCVLLFSLIFGLIRSSDVYEHAVSRTRSAPAVVEALGMPIEEGPMVMGQINVTPTSGDANLAIPISGPHGAATIYVEAEKYGGAWTYYTLEVAVHGGDESIDLLADP